MQTICNSLQTDNLTNTSSFITNFFTGRMICLTPNQQCKSTKGTEGQMEELN